MCGIIGYIGEKEGVGAALKHLKKLEYRGYDSAGIAYAIEQGSTVVQCVVKRPGKIEVLEEAAKDITGKLGAAAIAHSRWATHGVPNEVNAHPHQDCKKEIAAVHNGIIENYRELRSELRTKGHKFLSETDTEVVPHLIEEELKHHKNFETAFRHALKKIRGAYAFAIVWLHEPQAIYFARLGSPLVLGLGNKEYIIASDPIALAGAVPRVIYLEEHTAGKVDRDGWVVYGGGQEIVPLDGSAEAVAKGKFPHFMLKEIFEDHDVVDMAMRGRLLRKEGGVKLGGLELVHERLKKITEFELVACGTSYFAAMVGRLLLQDIAQKKATAMLASEYRYEARPKSEKVATLCISQSGETADTRSALQRAKSEGNLVLGIVNVVGSSIARETDAGVYNHAGPEIGVASTKAFLSQLTVLTLIALSLTKDKARKKILVRALAKIPSQIQQLLGASEAIRVIAKKYYKAENFLYIGRGYNYASALEGALKLKEISYIHAEGCAAGEMKHGTIALIDKNFGTLAIAPQNDLYEKMISNIQEIKARGGRVIAVGTSGDMELGGMVDDLIEIPKTEGPLEPLLAVVPLQLFAYHMASLRGCPIDKPRNLAKSVTVE